MFPPLVRSVAGGAVCALLVLGLTGFAMETLHRAFLAPFSYSAKTTRHVIARAEITEVLFLGQSDVRRAILEDAFPMPVSNAASPRETYHGAYFKLRDLLDRLPRLRLVVLPLEFSSFTSKRRNTLDADYFYCYVRWRELPGWMRVVSPTLLPRKLSSLVSVLERKRLRESAAWLAEVRRGRRDPADPALIGPGKTRHPADAAPLRADQLFLNEEAFDSALLASFGKTLDLCAARGIPVVTVCYPVSDRYLERCRPFISRESLRERILDHPEYRDRIFRHLDYLDWNSARYELFLSPDHLNAAGGALFSQDLALVLQALLPPT